MPTTIFAAVAPPEMVSRREDDITFITEVIFVIVQTGNLALFVSVFKHDFAGARNFRTFD